MDHGDVDALILDRASPSVDYTVSRDPCQVEKAKAVNPNQTLLLRKIEIINEYQLATIVMQRKAFSIFEKNVKGKHYKGEK